MAKQNVYCLYDCVDSCYTQPFYFARTDASIARQLSAMFVNENKKNKERGFSEIDINEYRLYRLAEFDDETGVLVPEPSAHTVPFNQKDE